MRLQTLPQVFPQILLSQTSQTVFGGNDAVHEETKIKFDEIRKQRLKGWYALHFSFPFYCVVVNFVRYVCPNPNPHRNVIRPSFFFKVKYRGRVSTCPTLQSAAGVKKYFCIFCKQTFTKLNRHLEHKHNDQEEVQEMLKYPKRKCFF